MMLLSELARHDLVVWLSVANTHIERIAQIMTVHKFTSADATFERSPAQAGDISAGTVLDQRHGGR
jgi:hypothetical protein